MTIPSERTRAVQYGRDFLIRLAGRGIKRVPRAVREEALRILRHYPGVFDLAESARGQPYIWGAPE